MRKMFKLYLLLLLGAVVVNCEDDAPGKRDWPDIVTHEITNITNKGAVFNGQIIQRGNFEIVSYGFVWSKYYNLTLEYSEKVIFRGNPGSEKFSAEILTTLQLGSRYWVKSFVMTPEYTVYGEAASFNSLGSQAPWITSISPAKGKWGDTVRISGAHFSFLNQNNSVLFGSIPAKTISSTDSLIITTVPSVANSEVVTVSVSIFGNKSVSPVAFSYLKPVVTGISPQDGTFEDILTINGINFSTVKENVIVKFDKYPAQVITATATSLTVKVPPEITLKTNPVTVSVNQLLSNSDISFIIKPPTISSIQAISGFTGDQVTINGNNFNPTISLDSVFFSGNPAVISSASKNTIVVRVPSGIYAARSFPIEVRVAGSKANSAETFTLKDIWIRKADVPHMTYIRYGATAFSINGYGYVGLGYGFVGSNFWKYDPQTNKWSEIARYPGGSRMRAAGFVIGNKAYVGLGGVNLHDFNCYDPSANSWTRVSDFPAANIRTVSLSLNNKGYVITDEASSNFWEYDAASDTWTKKKDFPRSTSSYPFYPDAGFCINNKIYLYATDRSTSPDQLWEYDFGTDTWTRKSDIVNSDLDMNTTGYTLNGKGYIRGKYNYYEYDPVSNSWSTLPQNKMVPGVWNFREYSIAFQIGNSLYFGTSSDGWGIGPYLYDLWEYDQLF